MAYYFKIVKSGITYDISNYVTDMSDIPYYARNSDYTIVLDDMTFNISRNYRDINPTITFEVGDLVLIYKDTIVLFNGVISAKSYNYKTFEYEYEAYNKILDLRNYKLSYNDFPEASSSAEGLQVYGYTQERPFIKIDPLIDLIFAKIGYTLDWTYRDATQHYNNVPYLSGSFYTGDSPLRIRWYEQSKTMNISDLYLFVFQLYSVNQSTPLAYNALYGTDADNNRITLFDLLSKLNIITGYVFIPKDATTFYVTNSRTNPAKDNNYDEEYNEYTEDNVSEGASLSYAIPYRQPKSDDPTHYPNLPENMRYGWYKFIPWSINYGANWYEGNSGASTYNVKQFETAYQNTVDKETTDIDWYSHLIFWLLPSRGGSDHHACLVMPSLANGTDGLLKKAVVNKIGESFVREYENVINTEKVAAKENYISIDMKDGGKQTSKIITEIFS